MRLHRPFFQMLTVIASLGAVPFAHAASGDSSPFLLDTRNYTDSGASTVHTDKRTYLPGDTVPGSLRQAIANAATGETVDFDAGLSGGTITLGGSQLTLDKSLSVDASALSDGITISGNDASRIFLISGVSEVSLSNLTMTEGSKYLGGAVYADTVSSLTMQSCTLVGNRATAGGEALFSYRPTAVIDLVNCTVSGNEADSAGGLFTNGATIRLKHSTVANNTATISAGGIRISGGAIEIENSIVAGNSAPMAADILSDTGSGPISGTGTNLIGSNESVETAFPEGLLVGTPANPVAPMLAPLGDYGGPTQTMALRACSPAINAAGASALTTDQRGFARVGAPDIGAYEFGNAAGYGVWATEMISEGLDAGNADEDPSANGTEYALGTSVLISDPTSPNNPEVIANGSGEIEINFGFNPIAAVDTRWIIERTTDLENYTEIYRYDGQTSTGTPQAGISAVVGATSITVTDPNPPTTNVFYRFGAQTAP